MSRDKKLDTLKGIGIILMVVGHSGAPFTNFIYLFHMAIFFILAGCAHNDTYSSSIASGYVFLKKRILSLYKPFVAWNVVFLLLTNFFIEIYVYTDNVDFLALPEGAKWGLIQHVGGYEIAKKLIQILTFGGGQQLAGVSWFLVALFTVSIAYNTVDLLLKLCTDKNLEAQLLVSLVLLALGYKLSLLGIQLPRLLSASISIYILFFIGKVFQRYSLFMLTKGNATPFIIAIVCFLVLVLLSPIGSIALNQNEYNNPIFFLLASISGWFLCFSVSELINKTRLSPFLSYVGRHTIPIMFLHFLAFKVVNYIYVFYYQKPLYVIASFPTANKSLWIYYSLAGVTIPLLLNVVYERFLSPFLAKVKFFLGGFCLR